MRVIEWIYSELAGPSQPLPLGGEVSWEDGAIRLALLGIAAKRRRRGWFSSQQVLERYEVQLRVTTPGHGGFLYTAQLTPPTSKYLVGPFHEVSGGLFTPARYARFQIDEVREDEARVFVSGELVEEPADTERSGALTALAPEACRFVEWWQQTSYDVQWAEVEGAKVEAPVALEGYELRIGTRTSASRRVTFHRSGAYFYVRSYGGCYAAFERWHGPYITSASAGADDHRLAR